MANRGYGYQYETSPRKLEPEYKRPNIKKKKPISKKPEKKNKTKKKFKFSFEAKFFIYSMLIFSMIFAIIACEALVKQRYKEKENLKKEYSELLAKSNMIADVNDDIRVLASEYGMQTKSATLIDLGTSDYIESSESKVETEEKNFLESIIQWIKSKF